MLWKIFTIWINCTNILSQLVTIILTCFPSNAYAQPMIFWRSHAATTYRTFIVYCFAKLRKVSLEYSFIIILVTLLHLRLKEFTVLHIWCHPNLLAKPLYYKGFVAVSIKKDENFDCRIYLITAIEWISI